MSLVDEFRLEHHTLPVDELEKLVKKTFRIDQSILRELDGWVDYFDNPISPSKIRNFLGSVPYKTQVT